MTFTDLKDKIGRLQLYYDPIATDHYFCYENSIIWSYDRGDHVWDKFELGSELDISRHLVDKLSRVTPLSFLLLTGLNPKELFAFNKKDATTTGNPDIVAQLKQQVINKADQKATARDVTIFCKHLMSISRKEAQAVLAYIAADKTVCNSTYARDMMLQLGRNNSLYYRILGFHNTKEFWKNILVRQLQVMSNSQFDSLWMIRQGEGDA